MRTVDRAAQFVHCSACTNVPALMWIDDPDGQFGLDDDFHVPVPGRSALSVAINHLALGLHHMPPLMLLMLHIHEPGSATSQEDRVSN